MPIYEYLCSTCQYKFDKLQPMVESGCDCPRCGQPAKRAISLFSALTEGDDGEMGSVAGMGGCGSCGPSGCGCGPDF